MANSKLVSVVVKAHPSNYTKGRTAKISEICIHHMAGVLSASACGNIFAKQGRGGSSHYGIGVNGEIGLYVDECDTAWTNSNWNSNCKSVTIEVSNSKTGGDWPVSDASLKTLIKLVADISKRNNIALIKGKTLTWHSMYASTDCPGNYLRSKIDYIITEANKLNKIDLQIEDISNKKVVLNKDTSLWNLEFTNYSEVKSVKAFKKGDVLEVSALATHPLGSKYYLTEYSFSNKIHNGFNIVDCDDYVEKVEEPKKDVENVEKDGPTEIEQNKGNTEEKTQDNTNTLENDKNPLEGQINDKENALLWLIDLLVQLVNKIIQKLR